MIDATTIQFQNFFAGVKNQAHTSDRDKFTYKVGSRYIKIIRDGSAHCFVDRTNGDVLKAASWNAPAKHARGNINHYDFGLGCMGMYGAAYLR